MSKLSPILVFDLDGTLADTAPDLIGTLNVLLTREGLPSLALDMARPLVGAGARALVDRKDLRPRERRQQRSVLTNSSPIFLRITRRISPTKRGSFLVRKYRWSDFNVRDFNSRFAPTSLSDWRGCCLNDLGKGNVSR